MLHGQLILLTRQSGVLALATSRLRSVLFPTVMAWKAYAVVIVAALLPAAVIAAAGVPLFGTVERQARERELRSVCRLLDLELAGRFGSMHAILEAAGAVELPAEEQARALHAALQPVVDRVCAAYPGVEVGYYSRALGLEVAAGRGLDVRPFFRARPPEDFRVYQTGRPEVSYEKADGKMLGARTTATQAYPLYDGAELTGHVWASVEARQLVPNTVAATMSVFGAAAASAATLLVAAWWLMNALGGWEREAATRRTTAANQLAAEVVHELRNPISVARGLAQLVMSEDDDLRRRMWLGNLVRQLDHMNTIASDYLRYARPAEPSLRSVPVGEILGELECVIRSSLDSTCVDFEVSQGPDPLEVMCDPDQLNQVLLNLAKNAVEAVSGEPRAQVCVRARPNGKTVLIDVCDSGPPIPDADLPRLFEPFFTTKPKGTGLGLAISKRLIERQGGSISARNTPDGAMFTVSLPAGRDGAH